MDMASPLRQVVIALLTVMVVVNLAPGDLLAEKSPPAVGGAVPDVGLRVPENLQERQYLGLKQEGEFRIADVKAQVVIIEILSMYCPYCQAEAPKIVELYEKIEASPRLKEKIKMVGIGAGNTPYELKIFRDKYKIPFPLLEDSNYRAHEQYGKPRTPYFVVALLNGDGTSKVIYSKVGGIGDPAGFLGFVVDKAGLK
jgi:peroxiredoxin